MLHFKEKIPRFGRLCETTVHGSTRLTTNGVVSLEIEYLSVRPEHRRRAPREFSHSLAQREIFLLFERFERLERFEPTEFFMQPLLKDFLDKWVYPTVFTGPGVDFGLRQ